MTKILKILSSISGSNSQSNRLADAIADRLQSSFPQAQVVTRDLTAAPPPHFEQRHSATFRMKESELTSDQRMALQISDEVIGELLDADFIIIGVPMYNFNIPSTLKSWLDQLVRPGKTFSYATGAPVGLLTGKKVYLAMASGGVYSSGPMKNYDFIEPYLRFALGFLGLTDVVVFRAEGLALPELNATAMAKAVAAVEEFAFG